ncbi:Regulator of G protein signaling superfamily [Penicillium concentricum]|uniref:Regulator of G protein signaling superfamily n=1 Tax=Penicillium concentricum TaxID=293559 RepID=A0A9W9SV21_9EURO|nr:Regulator of G protein signaling superfamily [Penicillium concentricum]KAJ5385261.1 Regulator of G protein signaling superfamily [Penicillium concentricum]
MLKKKTLAPSLFFRNHTPTATPELSPTSSDSDSEEDMESSGSRPVSLAISSGAFSMRPTLDEVLANIAPPPYTLSAFMAYLSQNHCLETLEFTMEANRYRDSYYALAERLGHAAMESECPETQHLRMLWKRLLAAYIFPGSPREINLSSEVRDALLQYKNVSAPPYRRR